MGSDIKNVLTGLRSEARIHLEKATEFLASNEPLTLRHAALELRLAIECVCFSQLAAYLDELPQDAVKRWTPKQVIDQLLEIDPSADKSSSIAFGKETSLGVLAPDMAFLGEDRRFTLKWANESYAALGSFLHIPTLHQIQLGKGTDATKIREKCSRICDHLTHVLSANLFNVNFGVFYEFHCQCGSKVRRREAAIKKADGIKCFGCGAIYDVSPGDQPELYVFKVREQSFDCSKCSQRTWMGSHKIKDNALFTCVCGERYRIGLCMYSETESESAPEAK